MSVAPTALLTRPARRRAVGVVLLVVLIAVFATACGGKATTAFDSGVEKNFVRGCTTGQDAKLADSVCKCIYSKVTNHKGGMTFAQFKAVQDQLRKDKKPLDQIGGSGDVKKNAKKLLTFRTQCEAAPAPTASTTTAPAAATSTTAAATSTTAAPAATSTSS